MSNKYRITIGAPGLRALISHLVTDEGFVTDLRQLMEIDEDDFATLAHSLQSNSQFLDSKQLKTIVSERFSSSLQTIVSVITRLSDMIRNAEPDATKAEEAIRSSILKSDLFESEELRNELVRRIVEIALKPAGLALQHKAERLAKATGAEIETLQIICDLRPVYDLEHKHVIGAIPACMMRVEFDRNGNPDAIEFRLSERNLKTLQEEVNKAFSKLDGISEIIHAAHLHTPCIKE